MLLGLSLDMVMQTAAYNAATLHDVACHPDIAMLACLLTTTWTLQPHQCDWA